MPPFIKDDHDLAFLLSKSYTLELSNDPLILSLAAIDVIPMNFFGRNINC